MFDVLASSGEILASGSNGDGFPLGALLLLAGPLFYLYVFFRYRNADKRHRHEAETTSSMHNVQVADQLASRITGSRSSRMQGANNRRVKGSQSGMGGIGLNEQTLSNITNSFLGKK